VCFHRARPTQPGTTAPTKSACCFSCDPHCDSTTNSWRAANAGSKRKWGRPSLLELAVIQREYPDEFFYLSGEPVGLQKAMFASLAVPGRIRGYQPGATA